MVSGVRYIDGRLGEYLCDFAKVSRTWSASDYVRRFQLIQNRFHTYAILMTTQPHGYIYSLYMYVYGNTLFQPGLKRVSREDTHYMRVIPVYLMQSSALMGV